MPTAKTRHIRRPTDEEEPRIQAGIEADPANPEWTDEDFARARPASEVLPPALYAALTRPRGRPKAAETKVPVKLRIDRETLEIFKAQGAGWQTEMNAVLRREARLIEAIQRPAAKS